MGVEVKMPRLSQTTDEVRFVRWLVHEGDVLKKGDPLCEVETDKVTMEVESFTDGTVQKLITEPDTVVDAGTVIAVLAGAGENGGETPQTEKNRTTQSGPAVDTVSERTADKQTGTLRERNVTREKNHGAEPAEGVKATPLVVNIAKKRGIDLRLIQGTGPGGLITRRDLDSVKKLPASGIFEPARQIVMGAASGEAKKLTRAQAAVARNMVRSKLEIPHYYLKTTVYVDGIVGLIDRSRHRAEGKLSVYSVFLYTAARTLKEMPGLNGFFKENRVVLNKDIHVGFALESGEELFVPVVRNADRKSIDEIDREVKRLSQKAKNGNLEPDDVRDGTFTITNLGIYPVDEFYAIINYPQLGILAMGTMGKTIFIDEKDAMRVRRMCTVTGSFDHRCINGARGAKFLQTFKRIMEEME